MNDPSHIRTYSQGQPSGEVRAEQPRFLRWIEEFERKIWTGEDLRPPTKDTKQ